MNEYTLLAGDIGATNTKLAFYTAEEGLFKPLFEKTLKNDDFESFDDLLDVYLESTDTSFQAICFGIAGVNILNRIQVTNLGWDIDGTELQKKFSLKGAWLLNDLQALSYAVVNLRDEDLSIIRTGKKVDCAPIAVIAPGTGLGEGFLTWDGEMYQAQSTEGGHVDFGPTNDRQVHLLNYLQKKLPRVSYENVCSGIGIPNLYDFLRDQDYAKEPEWLREKINQVSDSAPVIFNTALDEEKDCELCRLTVELFAEILGAEAGNLALKTLAQGGIYIGGGIPPRILPWLKQDTVIKAITEKDPHTELMSSIPVMVITNPIANLIGAAYFGFMKLSLL